MLFETDGENRGLQAALIEAGKHHVHTLEVARCPHGVDLRTPHGCAECAIPVEEAPK